MAVVQRVSTRIQQKKKGDDMRQNAPSFSLAQRRSIRIAIIALALFVSGINVSGFKQSNENLQETPSKVASAPSPVIEMPQQRTRASVEFPGKRIVDRLAIERATVALEPLPADALDQMEKEQIGINRPFRLSSNAVAQQLSIPDGNSISFFAIRSPGAEAIRVHFVDFDLPEGDQVHVYGLSEEGHISGPHTRKGPFKDKEFWSDTIEGDTAIIEHYGVNGRAEIHVSEISHIYLNRVAASISPQVLNCHNDAQCFNDPEKNAVGRITFIKPNGTFVCTGSLLIDRARTFQPYFLTAGHCISSDDVARTAEVFWLYRTTSCNSGIVSSSWQRTFGGATLLVTNTSSDSTLLRLLGSVPGGLWFSGWSPGIQPVGTSILGLHHPSSGTPPSAESYLRRSSGQIIGTASPCSATGLASGYLISWSSGVAEQGSSGSGIWITEGGQNFLVGVLSCVEINSNGNAFCGSKTIYGKFSDFYPFVRSVIDPVSCTQSPISIGETANGALVTSDCQSRKGLTDQYTFSASAGQQISISLSSTSFDTFLSLIAPGGALLAENDDGGDGTNSRIPSGSGVIILPSSGVYTIEVASFAGNSTGNYTLSLRSQSCTYAVTPSSQSFGSGSGAGSLSVLTDSGCGWTASSNASWLSITSAATGTGNSNISYSVAANTSSSSRTGIISVQGQTHTVTQAGVSSDTVPVPLGLPIFGTIAAPLPNNCLLGGTQYTVEAGGLINSLTIDLNGNQNVELFVRFGQRIIIQNGRPVADFSAETTASRETITISPLSTPAFQPGVYFIAVGNCGTSAANFTITVSGVHVDIFTPEITGASVSGKNLLVFGRSFDSGASISVDGVIQNKTSNDTQNPTTLLIAKKAGKKIRRGQTVTLQVRNNNGVLSQGFRFTRP